MARFQQRPEHRVQWRSPDDHAANRAQCQSVCAAKTPFGVGAQHRRQLVQHQPRHQDRQSAKSSETVSGQHVHRTTGYGYGRKDFPEVRTRITRINHSRAKHV